MMLPLTRTLTDLSRALRAIDVRPQLVRRASEIADRIELQALAEGQHVETEIVEDSPHEITVRAKGDARLDPEGWEKLP